MEPGEVNHGGLLVAGRDAPPLLEAIDASLDGVPLLVSVSVKHGWSATVAAASHAVGPLVGRDRNHGTDRASSQMGADGAGGIRLSCQDHRRPCAGPSTAAGYAQGSHDAFEGGSVPGLARREDKDQRSASTVGGQMDLRGQAAA